MAAGCFLKIMAISKRLKLIADLVTPGGVVADIGTDHAKVPLYLLKEGKASKAIAIDVSKECLKKAQDAVSKYNLEGILQPRLSDGLDKLEAGEADSIIISGMGGILMTEILERGKEVAQSAKELILSPHRDRDLVIDFLKINGFEIVFNEIITDKNKEYCVIKAMNGRFFLKESL